MAINEPLNGSRCCSQWSVDESKEIEGERRERREKEEENMNEKEGKACLLSPCGGKSTSGTAIGFVALLSVSSVVRPGGVSACRLPIITSDAQYRVT